MELVAFESGDVEKWVEIAITDDEKVEKERESIHLYLTSGDEAFLTPFPILSSQSQMMTVRFCLQCTTFRVCFSIRQRACLFYL